MSTAIQANLRSIKSEFIDLSENAKITAKSHLRDRINKLNKIKAYLSNEENLHSLEKALYGDFKKSSPEFRLTELTPIMANLKFIKRNLSSWMRDEPRQTPLLLTGSKSYIRYQAKGAVLIIAPWNYPFSLCINPLLYAIAAGNTIALKPSENTPLTSQFISQMMTDLFPKNEVQVYEGDAEVAINLLSQPFNHIYFTGSPQVGKKIMEAASKHLSSVTLELGGKSPAVIDKGVNLKKAAEKLIWGKCTNSGQTCIAPDYLLVHEDIVDAFIPLLKKSIQTQYGSDSNEIDQSRDYTRIVNERHFKRLKNLLHDAINKGAKIELGGKLVEDENFIAPTLISNVTDDMLVMQEEIFGPLLPLIKFSRKEEIISEIDKRSQPLVIYINSNNKNFIKYIIDNTTAGGTVINDYLIHFGNPDLPFGGINNSGIGKGSGKHGFIEFSNERGIVKQQFGTLKMIYPPYTESKKKLINFLKNLV